MINKVVLHNSVSLDGSFVGLDPDMELHYRIVGHYRPDAYMAGSATAKSGIEMFGPDAPPESEADFEKPAKDPSLAYWVIPDTRGTLQGLLHHFRRYEHCRDVIVLVSKATPASYLSYLDERGYDHIQAGDDRVDHRRAFGALAATYGMSTILVDSGRTLGNVLLNAGLVDEISLLVAPQIVGRDGKNLFADVAVKTGLACTRCEMFPGGHVWLTYDATGRRGD